MYRPRPFVFVAAAAAVVVTGISGVAGAQTISQSGVLYPDRIVGGVDVGSSERPQNLNPNGVSYTDCTRDMTLRFSISLNGFTGSDSLKVWASLTSDCTAMTDRGVGSTAPICWVVNQGVTDPIINTAVTQTYDIRVRDLVGWEAAPPADNLAANPPPKGIEACTAQASFAAVPININFLAIDSSGNSDGTPYQYTVNTDMVGPPAPTGVNESVGHTLFNVSWSANTDSDTAGYDVYIDPIPGQENAAASGTADSGLVLVCPDAGTTPTTTEAGTDGEAGAVTVVDASTATSDAGCYYVSGGGSALGTSSSHCNDPTLQSSIESDAAADAQVVVVAPVYDEAGDLISEGGTENGVGGISTIAPANLVGASGYTPTISDKAVGQYMITGLVDNVWYNVVVAAVDGTGNVGPPSGEVCDYPAAVKDFWETYKEDGGAAGGFCALDTVGVGGSSLGGVAAVLVGAAVARRRRRSRNPHRS